LQFGRFVFPDHGGSFVPVVPVLVRFTCRWGVWAAGGIKQFTCTHPSPAIKLHFIVNCTMPDDAGVLHEVSKEPYLALRETGLLDSLPDDILNNMALNLYHNYVIKQG